MHVDPPAAPSPPDTPPPHQSAATAAATAGPATAAGSATPSPPLTPSPRPARTLPAGVANVLVFLSGGAVLVLEILSLRLVAPYIGLTLETNSAVIGIALLAIAVGAWLGGRTADLTDPARLLSPALVLAGALTMLTLPAVRWVGAATRGGDVSAVLLVAAAAVFLPAALLSAVSPLVVKLRLRDIGHTGRVVGQLSGLGTLGAIVGTFVTGFVLVAALPSSTILLTLGLLLVVAGLALGAYLRPGRARGVAGVPPAALGLAALAVPLTVVAPRACEVETAYHCARVVPDPARPTGRVLELDTLRHSYVDLADPSYLDFRYVRGMAAVNDVVASPGTPVRALFLGGGGFTLPRHVQASRPGSLNRVLEIDGEVVRLAERELGLRVAGSGGGGGGGSEASGSGGGGGSGTGGIEVVVGDARTALGDQPAAAWDLVFGDAFGGVAVPWHLTTREVVEAVRARLDADGIYALNVIDNPPNRFARAELATLAAVFPHTAAVVPKRGGNFIALAGNAPLPLAALAERLRERNVAGRLLTGEALQTFIGDAPVLRDDYAPVDQLLTPYAPRPTRR